ncbi:MAG: STAS domain-containing protein [Ruminococcaceae bacterium]|nr:STAS domain-containing protein [Oscillospiraceae bacterium]
MMNGDGYVTYEERGDAMVVRIGGEIDHHGAVAVRSGIDRVLATRRPPRVYLELSGVSFMDSSGLGLIMGRYALVKRYGGAMAVLDPSPAVIRIIRLAGMDKMVPIRTGKKKG